MSNLTSVTVTSGVPTAGTGMVSTLDGVINATNGPVDVKAASTAAVAADKALVVSLSPNSPPANRNALYATGTSNSGNLVAAFSLQTTELNSLANAALIVSSVGGSSGKFTNIDTGQGKLGEIFLTLGTVTTMTAGGSLSGWFLLSPDSGTTLESLTVVPPRGPDFYIPLDATTGNKTYKAYGQVKLPALQFKVLVQNNSGQAFTSSGNILKLAPIAELI